VRVDRWTAAEVTYPEQGATRGALPPGYRHAERRDRLGAGSAAFDRAADAVNAWRMHRGAGFTVLSAPATAEPGATVVMRLGPPMVGIVVPCRVIYTVDEPNRRGFAYGTLPGHPVTGEEAFVVGIDDSGEVYLTIRAFSRGSTPLARATGPLGRTFQNLMTGRYVRALRKLL